MERVDPTPAWVEYVLRTRQSYLGNVQLDEQYYSQLERVYTYLVPEKSDLVGLFPIAHEDQTAFIVCNERDAGIFFDVGQSAILKSAFASLRSTDPQQAIFRLFLGTATLKISPGDRFLADKLGDARSGPYNGPQFVDEQTLRDARGALYGYAQPALQSLFDTIVDLGIVAHEMYHYRTHRLLAIAEIEQLVAANYDDFVGIATRGTGPFRVETNSTAQKEQYERELQAKHDYYHKERRMVSEEMACDLYAYISLATLILESTNGGFRSQGILETVLALNSIAFNFHLLHLAFTERAELFADGEIKNDFPGHTFMYNLRRVSVGILSSIWTADMILNDDSGSPTQKAALAEWLQVLQNRIYVEMSNSILMPAIPMLNSCFDLVEQTFPRETRREPEPTADPDERLFFSSLSFRLEENVLNRMLKSGAAQALRKRVLPFFVQGS